MKKIMPVCFFILAVNSFAQNNNSEYEFREMVSRHGVFYPLSPGEWDKNELTYFGFYIRINVQNGLIKTVNFSETATEMILKRNGNLQLKINEALQTKDVSKISDGVWVFPILCEMVTFPEKELQNNLGEELEKLIPESTKAIQVSKPILVRNYPPKR